MDKRQQLVLIVFFMLRGAYGMQEMRIEMPDEEVKTMLEEMLKNYDTRLRPNYTGDVVNVVVDASIMSFGKIDTMNMAFTLDMFFRQKWRDHRLNHSLARAMTLTVGTKHPADIIWVPDTVFINSITSTMHFVTVNNHKLDLYPNGTVIWGTRLTVSPACELNLRSYPMDTQNCDFKIVSYAHSGLDLSYSWESKKGLTILDKTMPQFELVKHKTNMDMVGYVAGRYSVLTAKFTFKRLMGHSILQIYIPCVAVVCVSWISLWIKRTSTPARVALCITTLLTVATLWGNANSTLPRVNYIKAVDVYLLTSFVFVLCTLIEYVIVLNCENIIIKKEVKKKLAKEEVELGLLKSSTKEAMSIEKNGASSLATGSQTKSHEPSVKIIQSTYDNGSKDNETNGESELQDIPLADYVEKTCKILFLVIYAVFNCVYWVHYLNYQTPEE